MSDGDLLRQRARSRADHMCELLEELVTCESPTGDVQALERCADVLAHAGEKAFGRPPRRIPRVGGPHLLWPGEGPGPVLLLGHFDTVWPIGTLTEIPFRVRDGVARGPGVFDMKAGIVQMLTAVSLLDDPGRVGLLLTCDEETGSRTSRDLVEEQARTARAVFVGEPSGDGGALKTARKGTALYELTARGRAAHAGLEPELGVNAGLEIAHQCAGLGAVAAPAAGTTVTPTVMAAGTTANTVPEFATLRVDARAWTRAELDRVDAVMRALAPHVPGATLTLAGGVNRYPLEAEAAHGLFALARRAARELGLPEPEEVRSGGGSDGNFTAALGVPTLDGLGAVGAHPHGRDEHVLIETMPDRTALLARLIELSLGAPGTGQATDAEGGDQAGAAAPEAPAHP